MTHVTKKSSTPLLPRAEAINPTTAPERLTELAAQSMRLGRLVASNPGAPASLLEALFHSTDVDIRRCLAANPGTPLGLLKQLAAQFPTDWINNPLLEFFLLEHSLFFFDLPVVVLREVVKEPRCPVVFLNQALKTDDEWALVGLCQNAATPLEIIHALKNSYWYWATVREAACLHIAVADPIPNPFDRFRTEIRRVLKEPKRRKETFRFLRSAIQVMQTGCLAKSSLLSVMFAAVAQDAYEDYFCDKTALRRLAQDTDREIRCGVAGNPTTPPDVLERLAGDEEVAVRRRVAGNPSTPSAVRESLSYFLKESIGSMEGKSPPREACSGVTQPQRGIKQRMVIETDLKRQARRFTVEAAPSVPRLLALLSPWAPVKALTQQSRSPWWRERAAIAIHPATPAVVRTKLADDGNALVRMLAQITAEAVTSDASLLKVAFR